jgi:hypothetical protein
MPWAITCAPPVAGAGNGGPTSAGPPTRAADGGAVVEDSGDVVVTPVVPLGEVVADGVVVVVVSVTVVDVVVDVVDVVVVALGSTPTPTSETEKSSPSPWFDVSLIVKFDVSLKEPVAPGLTRNA